MSLEIQSITIKNFRSIHNLTLPIKSYGNGSGESATTIFVGMNESGKSSILNAINLLNINSNWESLSYVDSCFLESQDDDQKIEIIADLKLMDLEYWRNLIRESNEINLEEEFIKKIDFIKVQKIISKKGDSGDVKYRLDINGGHPFSEYCTSVEVRNVKRGSSTVQKEVMVIEKSLTSVESNGSALLEVVKVVSGVTAIAQGQRKLTKTLLEESLLDIFEEELSSKFPEIDIWRPSSEFLINGEIAIDTFKDNPNTSIPLKNIFHVYGKTTDELIKTCIDKALSSFSKKSQLKEELSESITAHINKVWPEHKIKLTIDIDGNTCNVHVADKDKKHSYYAMSQRSDGFKQFVSLILSLSAQNSSSNLKNKIILIDEPEVHLHPSGIKYMRDELLAIGKNNSVIVATHSPYMVDTGCPERHWLVSKEKTKTTISQVEQTSAVEDDEVLAKAFGLSLFKELLPENIIVVEGPGDKELLTHVFKLLDNKISHVIKSAGGASRTYGIASILDQEAINAYFVFDDDKEGRDNKNKIIKSDKKTFTRSNVVTLRDLHSELPLHCTLEDLLPTEFITETLSTELDSEFEKLDGKPVLSQIHSIRPKLEKEKVEALKKTLSRNFIEKNNSKELLEKNAPKLVKLVNELNSKLGEGK